MVWMTLHSVHNGEWCFNFFESIAFSSTVNIEHCVLNPHFVRIKWLHSHDLLSCGVCMYVHGLHVDLKFLGYIPAVPAVV